MELDRLVKDCELAAQYAIIARKNVGDDFLECIRKVKAKSQFTWSDAEATELLKYLPKALQAIEPITLFDLRHNMELDDPRPWISNKVILLVAFALLVLMSISSFTIWIERATMATAEIAEGKSAQQARLFAEMLPILKSLSDDQKSGLLEEATGAERIIFRNQQKEMIELATQIRNDAREYDETLDAFPNPYGFVARLWRSSEAPEIPATPVDSGPSVTDGLATGPEPAGMSDPGADPGSTKDPIIETVSLVAQTPPATDFVADNYSRCLTGAGKPAVLPDARDVPEYMARFSRLVSSENAMNAAVRCLIGLAEFEKQNLNLKQFNGSTLPILRLMNFTNLWLLPALYGMLGATIFHLRQYLDPLRPNPAAMRIILRLCLSGFSGVAIAWFWRPDENGQITIAELTFGLASIAFVFGYSIEIFFNLLDRLVLVANANIANFGTRGPQ